MIERAVQLLRSVAMLMCVLSWAAVLRFDRCAMRGLVVGARRSLTGVVRGKRSLHGSSCQVHYPPAILEGPYFERPTPVLLAHGECLKASVWTSLVPYLTQRGCTVG